MLIEEHDIITSVVSKIIISPTLTIYLNPAQNIISIKTNLTNIDSDLTLRIYDTQGILVHQQQLFQSPTVIDINELSGGLYMVGLNNGLASKFIKMK